MTTGGGGRGEGGGDATPQEAYDHPERTQTAQQTQKEPREVYDLLFPNTDIRSSLENLGRDKTIPIATYLCEVLGGRYRLHEVGDLEETDLYEFVETGLNRIHKYFDENSGMLLDYSSCKKSLRDFNFPAAETAPHSNDGR
jgi:hypothetical protein